MKQCLIVVDMQRDFVTGALGFTGAAAIEVQKQLVCRPDKAT